MFIHGWGFDLEVWQPQALSMQRRWRVLRFDRRGFGLSTGTPSIASDVGDALALFDRLQLASAVLVGASQGARVALRVALAAPERVRGLVLDAPPDEIGHGRGALTEEIPLELCRMLARQGDMASVRRLWAEHRFTRLVRADPGAAAQLARVIARYPGADLLADAAPLAPLGDVRALAVPALVLNGEHDLPSRIDAGVELATVLPAARHELLAQAGHLANIDDPDAYTAAIE
ncbi:MAG TPA: alpha/beta hydrolase, partial [Polyangiaceae bacterium]|nr:alpha/beta hydrolase [Polyangiaceae bacterium]